MLIKFFNLHQLKYMLKSNVIYLFSKCSIPHTRNSMIATPKVQRGAWSVACKNRTIRHFATDTVQLNSVINYHTNQPTSMSSELLSATCTQNNNIRVVFTQTILVYIGWHIHTTWPFYGPFSRTTRARYKKKNNGVISYLKLPSNKCNPQVALVSAVALFVDW